MSAALALLRRAAHALLLLLLAMAGTVTLMRLAPGYFADAREMDAQHATTEHARLLAEQQSSGSIPGAIASFVAAALHGQFGRSRQYDLPVPTLLAPRLRSSANLLGRGLLFGWLLATLAALPAAATRGRGPATLLGLPFTLLLAIPAAAMATLSLHANFGGPALVLTLLIAARDFKFLERALREAFTAPHLLHARAGGLGFPHRLRAHVLPAMLPQLRALVVMSLLTALGALVPVEVLFDTPGLGQLAWNAALNRDLPVLLAVTLVLASVVAAMTVLARPSRTAEFA